MRSLAAVTLILFLVPHVRGQTYFDQIGYTALQDRLGAATPTGAGVALAQVEAPSGGNYLPDTADLQFSGITFTDHGAGGASSTHATNVGKVLYGRTDSIATGVTDVHLYNTNTWITSAYLNVGTGSAPLVSPARIQNLSFVGSLGTTALDSEALQRLDFAAFADDTIFVVGVNNGSATTIPRLFSSAYNSIAVGTTAGTTSTGPTVFEISGRSKPDIVAPKGTSSTATPSVASAAALLVETAGAKTDAGEAGRAGKLATIKAALLSGATTEEFTTWNRETNTDLGFVEPLDRQFGAGQLNINNSHLILSASEQNGTDTVLDAHTGWDFDTLTASDDHRRYYIQITNAEHITLTSTINWLRPIAGLTAMPPEIPTIEMRIYEVDSSFNNVTMIDSSLSPIDNVQHTRTLLSVGTTYAIDVRLTNLAGQTEVSFGAGWRTQFTPVPEPLSVLAVATAGLLGWRWRNQA